MGSRHAGRSQSCAAERFRRPVRTSKHAIAGIVWAASHSFSVAVKGTAYGAEYPTYCPRMSSGGQWNAGRPSPAEALLTDLHRVRRFRVDRAWLQQDAGMRELALRSVLGAGRLRFARTGRWR